MEEMIDQPIALLGQHRFGVELYSVHRIPNMLHGHDLTVFRRRDDFEVRRDRGRRNDE